MVDFLPSMNPPVIESSSRKTLLVFLSLYLGLFFLDGTISVIDDGLVLAWDFHALSGLRMMFGSIALLIGFLIYLLMAFTRAIPKRFFYL